MSLHSWGALLFGLALAACVQLTKAEHLTIEVTRGGTLDEKIAIAKRVTSTERYTALRAAAMAAFPSVNEERMGGLFLRWQLVESAPGGPRSVVVLVGMNQVLVGMNQTEDLDAEPIVRYCASLVEPELSDRTSGGALTPPNRDP